MDKKFEALKASLKTTQDIEVYKVYLETKNHNWFKTIIYSPLTPIIMTTLLGIYTAYKKVRNDEVMQKREIMKDAMVKGDSVKTFRNLKFLYEQGILQSDVSEDKAVYQMLASTPMDSIQRMLEGTWYCRSVSGPGGELIKPLTNVQARFSFHFEYSYGGKILLENHPHYRNDRDTFVVDQSPVACNHFDLLNDRLNVNGFTPRIVSITSGELVLDGMIPCLYGIYPDLFANNGNMKLVFVKL